MGRHDWEDRINMDVLTQTCGTSWAGYPPSAEHAYLRFRAEGFIVSIDSDKVIYVVSTGGRKPLKFVHHNIGETLDLIGAELSAHFQGLV